MLNKCSTAIEKCIFIYPLSSGDILKKPRHVYRHNVNCIFCLFFRQSGRRGQRGSPQIRKRLRWKVKMGGRLFHSGSIKNCNYFVVI